MGTLLFFFIALCIFTLGMVVISVTVYHWYKEWKYGKKQTESIQDAAP